MKSLIPMDDYGVFVDKHDTARVDSRYVAQFFEKEHRAVLRDIRELDCSKEFRLHNFVQSAYINEQGHKQPCYIMTRDGFVFLAMGYRGKKAAQFKELYIRRFNEMESFIRTLVSARQEFPLLTENIRLINDNPKPYHFSNECDMLNRIVLGMTAKQFRVLHGIEKKTSIRPYLTQEQINMLEVLQKADIGLLLSVPDFQTRKRHLEWYAERIKKDTAMADKYNAEGYFSPTEHEAFTRLEKEEKAVRKAAAFRPIVYICSPYSGDTERNIKNAKRYSRFAVDKHYLPIAPHIYFTQFMDDDIPEERDTAIFMNWVLMSKCVELWVFGENISAGMKAEIDRAKRKHMRIRYFTEELEEKL